MPGALPSSSIVACQEPTEVLDTLDKDLDNFLMPSLLVGVGGGATAAVSFSVSFSRAFIGGQILGEANRTDALLGRIR